MKYLLSVIILFQFSCSKPSTSSSNPEVTYEVILSNNGQWSGQYFDQTGAFSFIYPSTPEHSGWKLSFKPTHSNFIMLLQAGTSAVSPIPNVTINFYVNGTLVKTTTNPLSATLQYNL